MQDASAYTRRIERRRTGQFDQRVARGKIRTRRTMLVHQICVAAILERADRVLGEVAAIHAQHIGNSRCQRRRSRTGHNVVSKAVSVADHLGGVEDSEGVGREVAGKSYRVQANRVDAVIAAVGT